MSTSAGYGPDADREQICYRMLTTTVPQEPVGPVLVGWARHDDSNTLNNGRLAYFDVLGNPLPVDFFEVVPCDVCCPQIIGEGCWDDGTDSGTWIAFRDADGTITRTDPADGSDVADDDVVVCVDEAPENQTTLQPVGASGQFPIPASTLISWSVRAVTGTTTLEVNGTSTALPAGSIVESSAEDGATLSDSIMVTTGAASSALLLYVTRV